ncbi:MAG TPA: nicotinate phosphoribosyltransferase [Phycisphaerales bacterium]|nr:nicotinate phosphoribosyltransferase [Phycisphaerales bacterium]
MRLKSTALWTDKYEFTMAQAYVEDNIHERSACFDYFFRTLPYGGGYVVFAGLEDVLDALEAFRFDEAALDFLEAQGYRTGLLDYLSQFRFGGTVYAAREGEIVFANEPILRVEGTLIETQLVETVILNILNFQSLIATKAARIRFAAGHNKSLSDFGFRRAHGAGGIGAARAAIIGGFNSTSNMAAAQRYGLAAVGTMAHSYVQSYNDELTAFRAFAAACPDHCILLIDTYDTLNSGLPNAIRVAKEMEANNQRLFGIRLDSGDLAYMAKQARRMLDAENLDYVKIAASNQLDEYLVRSLIGQGAPIDLFGVGTRLVIGEPDGMLDGVYKLSMADGTPRLKVSDSLSKATLPGVKNILRYINGQGGFAADAVVLDDESKVESMIHPTEPHKTFELSGREYEELLVKVMSGGRRVREPVSVAAAADYAQQRLARLPDEYKRFEYPHIYKVGLSPKLTTLRDDLIARHRK